MSALIAEVTEGNFQEKVLTVKTVAIVDFWAPWCGPCRTLTPIMEDVAKGIGEDLARAGLSKDLIKFYKINIDNAPNTAKQYNIKSIPTIIIFENGQEVRRGVGGMKALEAIEEFCKELEKRP